MLRILMFFGSIFLLMAPALVLGQDETTPEWQLIPSIQTVDLFPSQTFMNVGPQGSSRYSFSGLGFNINTRAISNRIDDLAFTFSGGAIWMQSSTTSSIIVTNLMTPVEAVNAAEGLGIALHNGQFTVFPLTAGFEVEFPTSQSRAFMFFAGGDLSANFIDGDIDINQQIKGGYGFDAGFVLRPFEFTARYSAFSDIRNLGASIGLELNPINIR